MITAGKFSDLLENEFFKRLEAKTGWGKEELKLVYREAQAVVLRKLIDEEPTS